MTAILTVIALTLDWILGEPRRWHPLVGFGRWSGYLESRFNLREDTFANRCLGGLALVLAVLPPVLAVALLPRSPISTVLIDAGVLYFAIGYRCLREHGLLVYQALQTGDLEAARRAAGFLVSRDTHNMNAQSVVVAAVESLLENGNDAAFGAIFWFAVAGAPGVLCYRLVNTLDAMWGYKTPRYLYFGWAAARLDDCLNFIPARLTALSYALVGNTRAAIRCWRTQAASWESPNAGPVMASGAGALGVCLGGGAYYHGQWKERPRLGSGVSPGAETISGALRLIRDALLLWVGVFIVCEVIVHI